MFLDSLPKICGPKLSLCCLLISFWGVLQLAVMAALFAVHSVTLAHSVIHEKEGTKLIEYIHKSNEEYSSAMMRCAITAGLYLFTFLLSLVQFCVNKRRGFESKPKDSEKKKKGGKKKNEKEAGNEIDFAQLEKELDLTEEIDDDPDKEARKRRDLFLTEESEYRRVILTEPTAEARGTRMSIASMFEGKDEGGGGERLSRR